MTIAGHEEPLGERNGLPFYRVNPSVPTSGSISTRQRNIKVGSGNKAMLVVPDSGEVLGRGSIAYMEQQEVDSTKFVKIYLEGIRQVVGLTKMGLGVFEIVYAQVQGTQGQDQVQLSAWLAKEAGIVDRQYRRGLRELLEKELLFATPVEGVFFINVQYLFNGDRIHFVKSYHRRSATQQSNLELGFE